MYLVFLCNSFWYGTDLFGCCLGAMWFMNRFRLFPTVNLAVIKILAEVHQQKEVTWRRMSAADVLLSTIKHWSGHKIWTRQRWITIWRLLEHFTKVGIQKEGSLRFKCVWVRVSCLGPTVPAPLDWTPLTNGYVSNLLLMFAGILILSGNPTGLWNNIVRDRVSCCSVWQRVRIRILMAVRQTIDLRSAATRIFIISFKNL